MSTVELTLEEKKFIENAVQCLEKPLILLKGIEKFSQYQQKLLDKLPEDTQAKIEEITQKALKQSMELAYRRLQKKESTVSPAEQSILEIEKLDLKSHIGVFTTGAVGGLSGLLGLAIDLPLTTNQMMLEILKQGQRFQIENKEELLTHSLGIFALGQAPLNTSPEQASLYLNFRESMDESIHHASKSLLQKSAGKAIPGGKIFNSQASALLIKKIAGKFHLKVSEKFLTQLIPVIGAISNGAMNNYFLSYYGRSAHFHFGIKSLEQKYGEDRVLAFYRDQLTHYSR